MNDEDSKTLVGIRDALKEIANQLKRHNQREDQRDIDRATMPPC